MASDRELADQGTEKEPPAQDTRKGNLKTQHERERELIRQGLERYRTEPPDSNIRKGIDWLLQRHARWERFMQRDSLFRIRHNALVLEYIISHPMTHVAIEKRLGISDNGYKRFCHLYGTHEHIQKIEIAQKGHGKMEELLKSIKQTEKELEQAKAKRQKAEVEQFAAFDKDILRLELSLKRLKESQYLQRPQEKGKIPTDTFTQAKVFAAEMVSQVSEQGGDMNTDHRMIAIMRLTDIIDRLEMLKMASETTCSTAFPDNRDFTSPFENYIETKSNRIEKARKEIQKMDLEIERIEAALLDAMKAGNGKEIIEYSESLETTRKHREYLLPMLQEQEQSETIPQGAITQAWKETCDLYRHEFALRLEIIRTAYEIHKKACSELIEFDNLLKQARYTLQNFAKENGSPDQIVKRNQQITKDLDMSWLRNRQTDDNNRVYTKVHFNMEQLL